MFATLLYQISQFHTIRTHDYDTGRINVLKVPAYIAITCLWIYEVNHIIYIFYNKQMPLGLIKPIYFYNRTAMISIPTHLTLYVFLYFFRCKSATIRRDLLLKNRGPPVSLIHIG